MEIGSCRFCCYISVAVVSLCVCVFFFFHFNSWLFFFSAILRFTVAGCYLVTRQTRCSQRFRCVSHFAFKSRETTRNCEHATGKLLFFLYRISAGALCTDADGRIESAPAPKTNERIRAVGATTASI